MAALALQRDPDVLQNRKMRKHRRDLERAHEPPPRDRGRPRPGDLAAIEENAPARRREEMGEEVEARRFACAVRTDQRVNRPTPDRQIDVLDGNKALELFGQTLRRQDRVVSQACAPAVAAIAAAPPPPLRQSPGDYPDCRKLSNPARERTLSAASALRR